MEAPPAEPSAEMASTWVDAAGGALSESKRIIAAHSRHFLALSVLFLLPTALLLIAAPPALSTLLEPRLPPPKPPESLLRSHHPRRLSEEAIAGALLYSLGTAALALCAAASVTHSARRGFFGRPVRILSALCSLPIAFIRLLAVLFSATVVLCAALTLIVSLLLLSIRAFHLLHFQHLVMIPCGVAAAAYAMLVLYLYSHWALAGVVTVVESSWGFEPLRRSACLLKGMGMAAISLLFVFSLGIVLMVTAANLGGWDAVTNGWRTVVPQVAKIVLTASVTVVLLLYSIVTQVVLYMYCKALRGELAAEIAEEFVQEYVCLPFDDMKVPRVVSVLGC